MESLSEKQKHQIAMLLYDFGIKYSDFRQGMSKDLKANSLCTVLLSLFAQFCEEEVESPTELYDLIHYVFKVHIKQIESFDNDIPVM